jgi:hypothetical protein
MPVKITTRFAPDNLYSEFMKHILPSVAFLFFALVLRAENPTNPALSPKEDSVQVIECQGVKIWKKGKPTNAYTVISFDTLMRQRGFENAQNNIARGVLSRKGNAAIVESIINSQRLNFDLNTQVERLDGIDVRYQIIFLKP